MRDGREDIGILDQLERRRVALLFLDLARARPLGAPVGDGGGEYGDVGRQRLFDRFEHLPRGLDLDDGHSRRIGQVDRTAHQHDVGARCGRCRGDGVALLARRAVGDEAHRIDRLAGRTRGDEDALAGQRSGAAQQRFRGGDDFERLGHAADAGFARARPSRRHWDRRRERRRPQAAPDCAASPWPPTSAGSSPARSGSACRSRAGRRWRDRRRGRPPFRARRSAVAGATTIRSVSRARRMWPTSNSLCGSNRSV